jgi:hypothetical protein
MTVSSSDTITYGGYNSVSLCPAGRTCLLAASAYLVGYTIGDASGEAVAISSNTLNCEGCYTYTVLYAGGGPMDLPTLESVGIDPTTGASLLGN